MSSNYGSAPKLVPLNLSQSQKINTKKTNITKDDSDILELRKNISNDYHSSTHFQIGNILKEAR